MDEIQMDDIKEIPQKEWEDYVEIRDQMREYDKLPIWNIATRIAYDRLESQMKEFHSKYDEDQLNWRYDESLLPRH